MKMFMPGEGWTDLTQEEKAKMIYAVHGGREDGGWRDLSVGIMTALYTMFGFVCGYYVAKLDKLLDLFGIVIK